MFNHQPVYPILYIESKHSIFALEGKANKTHMRIGEFSREQKETFNTTIIINCVYFLFCLSFGESVGIQSSEFRVQSCSLCFVSFNFCSMKKLCHDALVCVCVCVCV